MSNLLKVSENDSPETERPDPSKLIAGDPVFTTWNLEERDGLYAGIWQSTPGKWEVSYNEWEYFRILEGVNIITDTDGNETRLSADDSYILRPGFSGTWEVVETTRKDYVIRL
ncbi:cupin domain-containing protein [Lentibacter algarum]|uniref:cupin domain-containing protein n=1 Tax=Lentibacter algarum TaxID=576131 RepID=UPI001C0789E8|nr:cupin domain-containing protein [Lentibacter algarum]MBU2981531.1 cupin domain-containing protein [Lentibacter algarum]